ncbi:MAG: phosphoglycerate mutase family protein [Lachnospiraceae bacterium]|nr:phosphoglycerate mutase family protein [Lachnospiraceae bacterium]
MKILLIRHGEPNYELDCLTEQGVQQAELLSRRMANLKIDEIYASPMGRAQQTAKPTLEKLGMCAETLPWAHEFYYLAPDPKNPDASYQMWETFPSCWAKDPEFFDATRWASHPMIANSDIKALYDEVIEHLNQFLSKQGFVREGNTYRMTKKNDKTIVLFCHFGLATLVMSYLLGMSPFLLWQGASIDFTGISELFHEEYEDNLAVFKLNRFNDATHLHPEGQ